MPDEAKAVLYLGHRYPLEVGQPWDEVTGKWSP
jgi:hypothetical protein